jgi:hypothetical protein
MDGIWMPYVHALTSPDSKTVVELIGRYFLRSLAPTVAMCTKVLEDIRSAWGILAETDAGHLLAHMAKCISVGLDCQARIYPIFYEGDYEGSILYGAGFTVTHRNVEYRPISSVQLANAVAASSPKYAILMKISTIAKVDVLKVSSMQEMRRTLVAVALSAQERLDVETLAARLPPLVPYWKLNTSTILTALELILDPARPLSDDVPMHPSSLFTSDRVALVLAAFGYTAPTFLIPSTPSFKLTGPYPENLRTFVYRLTPLSAAVADFHKMMATLTITNNPSNLSNSFQDRRIEPKDKDKIWSTLLKVVNAPKPSNQPNAETSGVAIYNFDI